MNTRGQVASWLFRGVMLSCFLLLGGAAQAADLSGCWTGTWESCKSGHHGVLRANFCRVDATHYDVHFSGRFFKLMPFQYSVTLNVVEDGDVVKLSGDSYLGRLFGTFTYDATATGCDFSATYNSCKDHGVFKLKKCCP